MSILKSLTKSKRNPQKYDIYCSKEMGHLLLNLIIELASPSFFFHFTFYWFFLGIPLFLSKLSFSTPFSFFYSQNYYNLSFLTTLLSSFSFYFFWNHVFQYFNNLEYSRICERLVCFYKLKPYILFLQVVFKHESTSNKSYLQTKVNNPKLRV